MPQELLATPLGQMLAPKLSPLEHQLGNIQQQPAGVSGAPTPPPADPKFLASTAQVSILSILALQLTFVQVYIYAALHASPGQPSCMSISYILPICHAALAQMHVTTSC